VFEKKDKDVVLDYCYTRVKDSDEKGTWGKCDRKGKDCKKQCGIDIFIDQKERSILQDGELKDKLLNNQEKHIVCREISLGNMHKALLEDIFTERFIPELDEYGKSRCKNKMVLYEYPSYTIFPEKEQEEYTLGLYYERKQIEILRQLASKFKVLRHGIKAALSAIIVRNHSHHIGSHVMPRATVGKIRERVIELQESLENCEELNEIVDALKDKLDEYIQKKADFTAEIATEPLTSTKTMKFFDEVVLSFVTNIPLMDNIGANEDVRYRSFSNNRLKIHFSIQGEELTGVFGESNCDEIYKHTELPYSMYCNCPRELQRQRIRSENSENKDVAIALPGCLGEYAIYAFLENFIRNGIKHNKEDLDKYKDKDYEIHVNVCEFEETNPYKDEFYKVEIRDNVIIDSSKRFSITKEGGTNDEVGLPEYLQHLIDRPIVNDNGSLRKEAWGIAEMKIMATLLRGSTDFTNMSKNLTVEGVDGYLVYEFYVMKPKDVAIISNTTAIQEKEEQSKNGIWWFNSLKDYENHILIGKSPASFKFLVIDDLDKKDSDEGYFKKITPILPFRVLINGKMDNHICTEIIKGFKIINTENIQEIKNIQNSDCSKILEITWKSWMDKFIEDKGLKKDDLCLVLFFQQSEEEKPTESWSKITKPTVKLCIPTRKDIGKDSYFPCEKNNILMYDRHFGAFNKIKNKNVIEFHEAFDKNSSDFIHIHSEYHYEKIYEFVEAALLKVLIIDERIAEVAHCDLNIGKYAKEAYGKGKEDNDGRKRLLVAKKAGIFICTHLCINNKFTPEPLHQSLNNKAPLICVKIDAKMSDPISIQEFGVYFCNNKDCKNCNGQKTDIDSIIIHQGVLENFFTELKSRDDYDAFVTALQEKVPYIIIDSGRGIPAKLPDSAKFLPFSLLEDFIMKDRIGKYSLTRIIMSLIRRKV
ncbi:MAG: hypothetical protein HOL31_00165, partial [Candidatus Scalindua sp.]|nr:hypothetical protein [Candidatus Scalindua sp.]